MSWSLAREFTLRDNIFGFDSLDSAKSMDAAFATAIASNIPWVAVLGNHDQEGTLSREGVMKYIVGMKNTLSKLNPPEVHVIDGFGNYNLEVEGVKGTDMENKSVLNLYFLDSGDYSTLPSIPGYGFGYHAYGKAGWSRRARVVVASLEKTQKNTWGDVISIKTWKCLDDEHLTAIDGQVLWSKSFHGKTSLEY
ncbi:putative inactive purple acid phosphatase 29 [Senna tora]|uniref:Putative inactive purple acid phosphatase 29 n=1 Tax=Senna tora TaxID=362788 RepID=A0A835CHV3_9FABA|nr:putative inactive purple acid phosphatase 29 [Senna tora]